MPEQEHALILLVEDDQGIAALVQESFSDHGWCTLHAASAREALVLLESSRPMLMLLDYSLPDSTGLELLQRMAQLAGGPPPFIVATGVGDEQVAVTMMKRGALDYLVKDSGFLDHLPVVVEHCLEKIRQDRRLHEAVALLRESESRFRTWFELPLTGICITSPEKGWLEVNGKICEILGYSREELLSLTWAELTHPDDFDANEEQFQRVLRGEIEGYSLEKRFLRKDGSIVPTDLVVRCLRKPDGNVDYFVTLVQDISERKRNQEHILWNARRDVALAELYRAIATPAASIADLAQVLLTEARAITGSRHGFVGEIDPATGAVLGLALAGSLEESLGADPGRMEFTLPRPADGNYRGLLGHALCDRQPFFTNVPARHPAARGLPAGHLLIERFLAVPVLVGNDLLGMVALANPVQDYTERDLEAIRQLGEIYALAIQQRRAEQNRRLLETQLSQLQRMESVGLLAGGVAHDMNNVLGAILAMASVQQCNSEPGSEPHRNMETIIKACNRGGSMVKGLLGFARQGLAEHRPFDLNELVREQAALLERTTLQRIRLELDLAEDLPEMSGDPAALNHALMNLCVNALDAMPEGGTLRLRTARAESDALLLEVIDTGTGMAKEVLDKALVPFFTTKPQGKGTGLGLSMVYGTVQAHQGRLDIDSFPGAGTRISIRFPLGPATPERPPAPGVTEPEQLPLNLLVVDDDDLIRMSVGPLLEFLGHATTLAASGPEAIRLLQEGLTIDAVILDMNMPGMDGTETFAHLRALRPDLPVFLATGRADQRAMDLIQHNTAISLLAKPFTVKDLSEALARISKVPAGFRS